MKQTEVPQGGQMVIGKYKIVLSEQVEGMLLAVTDLEDGKTYQNIVAWAIEQQGPNPPVFRLQLADALAIKPNRIAPPPPGFNPRHLRKN